MTTYCCNLGAPNPGESEGQILVWDATQQEWVPVSLLPETAVPSHNHQDDVLYPAQVWADDLHSVNALSTESKFEIFQGGTKLWEIARVPSEGNRMSFIPFGGATEQVGIERTGVGFRRFLTEDDTPTPGAHAETHAAGGSDPVTPAAIGASPEEHGHVGETIYPTTIWSNLTKAVTFEVIYNAGVSWQIYQSGGRIRFNPVGTGGIEGLETWESGAWRKILTEVDPPPEHTHDDRYSQHGHTHTWGDVTGKPSTFPPSAHTHDDRYSQHGHTHTWGDVTGSPDFAIYDPIFGAQIIMGSKFLSYGAGWGGNSFKRIENIIFMKGLLRATTITNTNELVFYINGLDLGVHANQMMTAMSSAGVVRIDIIQASGRVECRCRTTLNTNDFLSLTGLHFFVS